MVRRLWVYGSIDFEMAFVSFSLMEDVQTWSDICFDVEEFVGATRDETDTR